MNLIRTLLWHLDVARRARHARRDPLAGMFVPAPITPVWHPVPSLADDARDELLAAVTFDVRRGVASPDVRAAFVTWKEATA